MSEEENVINKIVKGAAGIFGNLGNLKKGTDYKVQVLHIPIPTSVIIKYIPDMIADLKQIIADQKTDSQKTTDL